jgi:hypothetical protein
MSRSLVLLWPSLSLSTHDTDITLGQNKDRDDVRHRTVFTKQMDIAVCIIDYLFILSHRSEAKGIVLVIHVYI